MANKEYTLEELNYFRICYITTNIIRDGLQSVFKQEWDRIHGWRLGPWQDTVQNRLDFFKLESTGSRNRNKRFLNIIQNEDTSEWDCACFFFAILFSDSLGPLLRPTVASNVRDLRDFRNGVFAHLSQASILAPDFQANVRLVLNAFAALHLDTKELRKISNQGNFPTGELQKLQEQIRVLEEEIQAKPKSFMLLPLKPSHEVTERKAEVEDVLHKLMNLQSTSEDGSTVTVYISGNPGCGKSQVARQVGEAFYDKTVTDGNQDGSTFVMTLNAESEQSMLDSYKKFALTLGVTEYSLTSVTGGDSRLSKKEQISHLKTLVSTKVQDYSTWLLILDNVNELRNIRDCWPNAEEWGGCGQVLVTTQDSTNLPFADPFCQHVSLSQGMQTKDALSLLRSICQFSCEDDEEEYFVLDALDYQPLAIASAALYVRYLHDGVGASMVPGSFTWKSYLKKLEMGKRNLTEKVYERTSKSYPLSMTSAVSLALQKLVQNQVFEHVVNFLALCAPAPIGLDVIVSFVTKQEPDLDEDMTAAEISKCSLLMHFCPDDSPRILVKMHQVVHDVFKSYFLDKHGEDEVSMLTQSYIETFSTFAQHNLLQFDMEFHKSSKMMAPHLKLLSSHLETLFTCTSDITSDSRNLLKKALLNFGDICRKHSHVSAAKTYFECALQLVHDDGSSKDESEVKFIATTRNNLGLAYRELGQFGKAKDHHEHALGLQERLHPDNATPEIADSLNKLGNVFYSLGRFERAKEYFLKSLTMREELYGRKHATVAASLNNLGSVYSVLGDQKIAEGYYQRSLALEETMYGKIHPHVADCLCNLGIVYSELGSTKKAIHYHKQALEMRKELYFPDHYLISESYNNLGLMYKEEGQLEEAMDSYERALRIREKLQDQEHPAVAELLSNLGQLYMDLGLLQKSKEYHQRALQIRVKVLEHDHCKLGDSMLNLGLVHEKCGEFGDAFRCFHRAREIYAKSFPTRHMTYQSAAGGLERVSRHNLSKQAELDHPDPEPVRSVQGDSWSSMSRSGAHWQPALRGAIPPDDGRRMKSHNPSLSSDLQLAVLFLLLCVLLATLCFLFYNHYLMWLELKS